MEAGREFQFLEVIGTNVLANEVVRYFSNLTSKECWESACYALGKIRKSHSIALRNLNFFKNRNTQRSLLELYGMAICLNLESLDREILQIKITIFEKNI